MIIKDTTTHRTIAVPKWTESTQFRVGSDSLRKNARDWLDAHYNTIMRIWTESEDCKILGLQDQIGKFQRGLGKSRAQSVLMYLTRKQYPNSPVPMTGFTPTSLVLANNAKTRAGLSQLHGLMNQRAFMLVCEKKATTMAKVKQFVRSELKQIRQRVADNESSIATLQSQTPWFWILGILGAIGFLLALIALFRNYHSDSGDRHGRNTERGQSTPPLAGSPGEPDAEDEVDEPEPQEPADNVGHFGHSGRRDIEIFDPEHREDGLMANISIYQENEDNE